MKKIIIFVSLIILSSCVETKNGVDVETINVVFAPVADEQKILSGFAVFEEILIENLSHYGYVVGDIELSIAVSAQAVAEALSSGTATLGYLNTTTYLVFEEDGIEALLNGTRSGLNVDSRNPEDWNDSFPLSIDDKRKVGYFYSLVLTGPSTTGKLLKSEYIQNGIVSWDSISASQICIGKSPTQTTSYIFPSMWLDEIYNKNIKNLSNTVPLTNSPEILASLAAESCDIGFASPNSMIEAQDKWQNEWGRIDSIWNELTVVGVTDKIENSVFALSKNDPNYSAGFKEALKNALLDFNSSDEGVEFYEIFSLGGVEELSINYMDSSRIALQHVLDIDN